MAAGITWKGMAQLKKALEKGLKQEAVKKIVKLNGAELQKKAKQRVPVGKTGFLKHSITLNIEDEGLTAAVTPTAHYAPYVEYGTRRYPFPRPFLRSSHTEQKIQFKHDLERLTR